MLPLLPLYATELGAPPIVLGLLTSAFAVTNAIRPARCRVPLRALGRAAADDRRAGRSTAAMNALIATAATAAWLLTWRTTAGFGGGAMIVSERIYLAQSIVPARRAFANGIISAAQSAGTVAGPGVRRLRRRDRRAASAVRDRRDHERGRPRRHALPAPRAASHHRGRATTARPMSRSGSAPWRRCSSPTWRCWPATADSSRPTRRWPRPSSGGRSSRSGSRSRSSVPAASCSGPALAHLARPDRAAPRGDRVADHRRPHSGWASSSGSRSRRSTGSPSWPAAG